MSNETERKWCPTCGALIPEGQKVCAYCIKQTPPDDGRWPAEPQSSGFQELNKERDKEPVNWWKFASCVLVGILLNFFLTIVFLVGPLIWIYYSIKMRREKPTYGTGLIIGGLIGFAILAGFCTHLDAIFR